MAKSSTNNGQNMWTKFTIAKNFQKSKVRTPCALLNWTSCSALRKNVAVCVASLSPHVKAISKTWESDKKVKGKISWPEAILEHVPPPPKRWLAIFKIWRPKWQTLLKRTNMATIAAHRHVCLFRVLALFLMLFTLDDFCFVLWAWTKPKIVFLSLLNLCFVNV